MQIIIYMEDFHRASHKFKCSVPESFADMAHTVGSCTRSQMTDGLDCACTCRVEDSAAATADNCCAYKPNNFANTILQLRKSGR